MEQKIESHFYKVIVFNSYYDRREEMMVGCTAHDAYKVADIITRVEEWYKHQELLAWVVGIEELPVGGFYILDE